MKHILLKSAIFAVLIYCTSVWSQDVNTANRLIQNINEALSQGNCDRAQQNYNAWKDIAQKTDSNIEARINSCKQGNTGSNKTINTDTRKWGDTNDNTTLLSTHTTQKLVVGQIYQGGRIAYLDASGLYGLLLRDNDKLNTTTPWLKAEYPWRIPTKEELEMIYKNKRSLDLFGTYWSSTKKKCINGSCYYTMDFFTGKVKVSDVYDTNLFTGKRSHAHIYRLEICDF